MPHVNSEPLDEVLFNKLFTELQKLISKTTTDSAGAVLSSLLTPTERVMLTKRFATIYFLNKGMTPYEIWNLLKLSPSTVSRINNDYKNGNYNPLIRVFKKSLTKDFFELLEVILAAGLPPRGKDRWRHVSGMGGKY